MSAFLGKQFVEHSLGPLSIVLTLCGSESIDSLHELTIDEQLNVLTIDNISSSNKRDELTTSLCAKLHDLNTNVFKRIRFKSILSSYYKLFMEIGAISFRSWTHQHIALSFLIHLIQHTNNQQKLSVHIWQFVYYLWMYCKQTDFNGALSLYQTYTETTNKTRSTPLFHKICHHFSLEPQELPFIDEFIGSWLNSELQRSQMLPETSSKVDFMDFTLCTTQYCTEPWDRIKKHPIRYTKPLSILCAIYGATHNTPYVPYTKIRMHDPDQHTMYSSSECTLEDMLNDPDQHKMDKEEPLLIPKSTHSNSSSTPSSKTYSSKGDEQTIKQTKQCNVDTITMTKEMKHILSTSTESQESSDDSCTLEDMLNDVLGPPSQQINKSKESNDDDDEDKMTKQTNILKQDTNAGDDEGNEHIITQQTNTESSKIVQMDDDKDDTFRNEEEIDWQNIGQILLDHTFMHDVKAINIALDHLEVFCQMEDIGLDDFRDALCVSYCNSNDEGTVLWEVLFHTLHYTKPRRAHFYDLLLHEYFTLSQMTLSNLIHILSKLIRDLNVSPTEFKRIKQVILSTKLDGHKVEMMDVTDFKSLFRSVDGVKESVWCLIYEELLYWRFQEFQENNNIDWESIGTILWENNFCENQDELNAYLDEMESYFQKHNHGIDILKKEICICYGNVNKSDTNTFLNVLLKETMHYTKQKRLQLYDILLHKYFDLEGLNSFEMINVLKRSVRCVDKNIDLTEFESIAQLFKLNGRDFAAITSAEQFADIFISIHHFVSDVWEKIYKVGMAKWLKTPTEHEHSLSQNALERLISLERMITPLMVDTQQNSDDSSTIERKEDIIQAQKSPRAVSSTESTLFERRFSSKPNGNKTTDKTPTVDADIDRFDTTRTSFSERTVSIPRKPDVNKTNHSNLWFDFKHIATSKQCEYLQLHNLETKQKRKELAQILSSNRHHQIYIKYILSKYYHDTQSLSTYVVKQRTWHQLTLSFISYVSSISIWFVSEEELWEFVDHFRTYCKDMHYDGRTLIYDLNRTDMNIKNLHMDICNVYFMGPHVSDSAKLERFQNVLYPFKKWALEQKESMNMSWRHVLTAIDHELYSKMSSTLRKVIETNDKYATASTESVDYVLNHLKERSKIDGNEIHYIKQLIERANSVKSRPLQNYYSSDAQKEWNENIDNTFVGLNGTMLYDIYNVHKCFLFGNYHFQAYTKAEFIQSIEHCKYLGVAQNKLFMNRIKNVMRNIPSIDLYPEYIIDDDMYTIWKYMFAASRLMNDIRHQYSKDLSLKIVIIPSNIVSLYDENACFQREMDHIYYYLMFEKGIRSDQIIMETFDINTDQIDGLLQRLLGIMDETCNENDVLIVVDRTENNAMNIDKMYIVFNCNIDRFSELNRNYNLSLQFDLKCNVNHQNIVRCYLSYTHRGNTYDRIRFYPEYLTTIVARFFKKNKTLNSVENIRKLYQNGYKHGFALDLKDTGFEKYYKIITKWRHVSVNYNRNILKEETENEEKYNEITKCTEQYSVPIKECPFIDYIISSLTVFKTMNRNNIDITAFNLSKLTASYTHLICIHSFCLDDAQRIEIKQYMCDTIGECEYGSRCFSMKQNATNVSQDILITCLNSLHCYLLHDAQILYRIRENGDNDTRNRFVTNAISNPLQFTDKVDTFIDFVAHNNDDQRFLRELIRWIFADDYDWESLHHDIDCNIEGLGLQPKQSNLYLFLLKHQKEALFDLLRMEYIEDCNIIAIDFGVSVLNWFSIPFLSRFRSLTDEALRNKYSNLTEEGMEIFKKECVLLLETKQTKYKYRFYEILSLKLYTDQSETTSLFRECFRSSTSNVMRAELYLWAMTIYKTFLFHARYLPQFVAARKKPTTIYHGLNQVFAINNVSPKYHGPVSTTSAWSVAEQFSNTAGLVWNIEASYVNPFKCIRGLDVSWVSRFKNESEILLNDEYLCISKAHHYSTDISVQIDHLLYQLKIYQHKIMDRNVFWRQIGFVFSHDMLHLIRIHPLLSQHSKYKPSGFKIGRKVFQRLYEELCISDDALMAMYVQDASIAVDDLIQRLQKYAYGKPKREAFLAESNVIVNAPTISVIQKHPLLFQYHIYKEKIIFEKLIEELKIMELLNGFNYIMSDPVNRINAVMNGLKIYQARIDIVRNALWKAISVEIEDNDCLLPVIKQHPLFSEQEIIMKLKKLGIKNEDLNILESSATQSDTDSSYSDYMSKQRKREKYWPEVQQVTYKGQGYHSA